MNIQYAMDDVIVIVPALDNRGRTYVPYLVYPCIFIGIYDVVETRIA